MNIRECCRRWRRRRDNEHNIVQSRCCSCAKLAEWLVQCMVVDPSRSETPITRVTATGGRLPPLARVSFDHSVTVKLRNWLSVSANLETAKSGHIRRACANLISPCKCANEVYRVYTKTNLHYLCRWTSFLLNTFWNALCYVSLHVTTNCIDTIAPIVSCIHDAERLLPHTALSGRPVGCRLHIQKSAGSLTLDSVRLDSFLERHCT